MKALMLNLYLTNICDGFCPSCYYPKGHDKMTYAMARKIVDWFIHICINDKVELFKIHFLGGEPFLNFEILCYIMESIKEFKPEHTKPHPDGEFVIFTNGNHLGDEKLRRLKFFNAKIMLNPCNDSLEEVENRILRIKKYMGGCSLAVVADDKNLDRLDKLTELAVKHRCHVRINRLYSGGRSEEYIEKFRMKMHQVFDILLASEWIIWPNFIMESTYPLWEGPKNCHSCGKWLLVLDPDGTIRSCNADVDTKIGHISTHIKMSDFTFPQRWSSKDLEECKGCEWANGGWCQGGCPFTRKLTYGTYDKKTPFCEVFKTLFPRLMQLKEKYDLAQNVSA